jgi:MoxR-like ATPase
MEDQDARRAGEVGSLMERVLYEVKRIVVGQDRFLERVMVAMLAQGHLLVEGVPGLAKTLTVKTLASTLSGQFKRIQFTPDLVPADLVGTRVYNQKSGEFSTTLGPVFTNLLLADEINRAPAKTQSALLEAMQESQVTIEGETRALGAPFIVLATQNPIEQEGTYPLPEAQVDRFLIKLRMSYPEAADEKRMLMTYDRPPPPVKAVVRPEDVLRMQALAQEVYVAEELFDYVLALTHYTRSHARVYLGASPRAALALLHACKAMALIRGRDFVLPDDVRQLASLVLSHRILMTPDAELEGASGTAVVTEGLAKVAYKTPRR